MKTTFLSISALFLSLNAFSQTSIQQTIPMKHLVQTNQPVRPTIRPAERGLTIWSDDFSTPSNWSRSNTSSPAQDWYFPTDVNVIPVASLAPANMTTAANGFAFINSDSTGSGATQNANLTLITPINLTAYPNVSLEFEHSYRTYLDTRIVRVSGDNGVTWTDFVVTDASSPTSVNSANPEVTSINISAVAGGQAQVLIQFNYQAAWGWYWAVDDVKIKETDANDLVINSSYWGSQGLPYFSIPTTQIAPIDFSVNVSNVGFMNQTSSVLTADVNGGAFTGTSAGTTVLAGATNDSLFTTTQYTPAAIVGAHAITMTVASASGTDATLTNNVVTDAFNVVDGLGQYGRDRGIIEGNAGGEDGNVPGDFAFEAGSLFDIYANQQVYSVDVVIGTLTPAGTIIYGKIYELDNTGSFIYVDQTVEYTTTAADATNNATIRLELFTAPTLTAGLVYMPVVGCYSEFYYGRSGISDAQTSFIMYPTVGGAGSQYYTVQTPMVRFNFAPIPTVSFNTTTSSVNENAGTISATVNLINPTATAITVDVALTGGSATNGSDFNFTTPTTVTFPAGSTTPQTITLTIIDDIVVEPTENIVLTLQNPSTGVTIGANQTHTVSIIDNEIPLVELSFTGSTFSTTEGFGSFLLYVSIANADANPTTVDVVITGGSATNGSDYSFTSPTTLTFPGGSSGSEFVVIDILNDSLIEPIENIQVSLQNVTNNAVLGVNASCTISITDNDFTGIDEPTLSSISMFPNPLSNGVITVKGIENMRVTMEVSNILGQQVYTTKVNANGEVNLQMLKAGTYFVTFINNNNRVSKRLIIN